jgi:RHS repeat-associated protein
MLRVSTSGGFKAVNMTAFGETTATNNSSLSTTHFFTGKPYIGELGYAFLFRNYRPEQGKWQTADPLGYPDGWNNLAYVNNGVTHCVDNNGLWTISIGVTLGGGGGTGGSVSVGVAFGYSAESGFTAGFYESAGGGSYVGAGGSVTGTLSATGAGTVGALAGTAMAVGGSFGIGPTIGGEAIIPTDLSNLGNTGGSFSIGFGGGPIPGELHTFVVQTFVQQIIQWGGSASIAE